MGVVVIVPMIVGMTVFMIMVMTGRSSLRREIRELLMQHIIGELQGDLVQHSQRPDGHACLHGDVLDQGGRHTFAQKCHALVDEAAEDPAGVETARVVHHDRGLADLEHEVEGPCHCFVGGLPPADDLHQRHLVHGREEMQTDEALGAGTGLGQPADWQGGGVGGEHGILAQHGFRFARGPCLYFAVLEYRLDHQIAAGEIGGVGGGLDQGERALGSLGGHGAALHPSRKQGLAVRLALLRASDVKVLENAGHATRGASPGDACAHHAGPEDANAGGLVPRRVARSAHARLHLIELEEQGADHVLGNLAGGESGQVP